MKQALWHVVTSQGNTILAVFGEALLADAQAAAAEVERQTGFAARVEHVRRAKRPSVGEPFCAVTISETKFNAIRARIRAAREKLAAIRLELERKYGPTYAWALNKTDQRRYDAAWIALGKAEDRMLDLLEQCSSRDWLSGVPAMWVTLDLSYADAIRPLSEPLSVVPPLSYGSTVHKK